jgi:hypothetical protein
MRARALLVLLPVLVPAACASSGASPQDAGALDTGPVNTADAGADGTSVASDASLADADASLQDATPDAPTEAGPDVDAAWTGRPPAAPLVVRNPYVSTWSTATAPTGAWPSFWTGSNVKAITGIARIDGSPYVFLGQPANLTVTPGTMTMTSNVMTPTKTEYVFGTAGVTLTVDFLSPIELASLKLQSEPLSYINVSAVASDGGTHAVSVYFDISGEWAHGDSTQSVNWAREAVPHAGGTLTVQSFTPANPQQLVEVNQYPAWGTAFLAADATSQATFAIGPDTAVRSMAATKGALDGSIDGNMPRAINDNWPVLGASIALGSVGATPTAPATLVLGHARNPAVSYLGAPVAPLWAAYWSKWESMVADAFDDAPAAATRAAALDARVVSDAIAAGGTNYAALCTLSMRQAFGGTELVGTTAKPWLMLKEISSDGNVSTVDVVYPASPVFLYANPYLLKLMLDPLLQYAETGGWPKLFAEHDLGSSYPNAAGHNDGNEEDMPVEESADMLLMMAGYAQRAKPSDAQAYAQAHYKIAKQWADYLAANTLDPVNQNQTDDFTGYINHSVNLALKGIVGIGAMSILAQMAGNATDQQSYLSTAKSYIATWATKAQATSGQHLLLVYDEGQDAGFAMPIQQTWSLKYNALYDRILGLDLVPASILKEEAAWYSSQAQPYGVQLDPRNPYTKTDWELWTAASIDDTATRQMLIDAVYSYATTSTARVPFGDLYYTQNGQWDAFQARPVQGGMFSLLARQGTVIVPQ